MTASEALEIADEHIAYVQRLAVSPNELWLALTGETRRHTTWGECRGWMRRWLLRTASESFTL